MALAFKVCSSNIYPYLGSLSVCGSFLQIFYDSSHLHHHLVLFIVIYVSPLQIHTEASQGLLMGTSTLPQDKWMIPLILHLLWFQKPVPHVQYFKVLLSQQGGSCPTLHTQLQQIMYASVDENLPVPKLCVVSDIFNPNTLEE